MGNLLKNLYHQIFFNEDAKANKVKMGLDAEKFVIKNNVRYGKDLSNIFDFIYPKNSTGKLPTIFIIHGGGYVGGFKEDNNKVVSQLVKAGYAVVNVEYSKSDGLDDKHMPTPVYEVFDVFKMIENDKEFSSHIDFDNIFLAGDSAGGHIASLIANIQTNDALKFDFNLTGGPKIKGLILTCPVFGVYNFLNMPIKQTYHNMIYGKDNVLKEICHCFDTLNENFPPSILFSTQKDIVARIHTNMFLKRARKLGLSVDFYDIRKAYKLEHNSMIKYADIYSNYCDAILNFIKDAVSNNFVSQVKNNIIKEETHIKKYPLTVDDEKED